MNSHKNALLTPRGREPMVRAVVDDGLSKAVVARLYRTTPKTVAKWVERFRKEGVYGLRDRSSKPLSLPSQTALATCTVIEALRRQRYTGKQIAAEVGVSPATVSRILRRLGLNRIRDLEPAAAPPNRQACPPVSGARRFSGQAGEAAEGPSGSRWRVVNGSELIFSSSLEPVSIWHRRNPVQAIPVSPNKGWRIQMSMKSKLSTAALGPVFS